MSSPGVPGAHVDIAPPLQSALTSVIIVAADSGPGLVDCVAKVLANGAAIEVIVVDNASADGSAETVVSRFEADARVRTLRNARNLGFGTGCNRGASVAAGDALLFLNPDCVVAPDTIARLRAAARPGIGLLGAATVNVAGLREGASRRRDPLLRRALMSAAGLARYESRWPALAGVEIPADANAADVEFVDAVSGALMYLPRDAFERVGGFDESYFLHAEDLDLCRRVRDAGLRVACANRIEVVHAKGGSSRHRPLFVAWHKHRGLWRWFVKFDPAARNRLLRVLVWSGLWLYFWLLAPASAWRQVRAGHQR